MQSQFIESYRLNLKHYKARSKAPKLLLIVRIWYWVQILHDIDISKIRLVSNTEGTNSGMIGYGLK
jgi:3,4-dihydroxy 2-butanone 4-phosphate synthase/GTP cyclohydrolase II